MHIESTKTEEWQPTYYVHKHHGGEDCNGFPFMTNSVSSQMQTGDILLPNITTLAGDFQDDSDIGEQHEGCRNEEEQGQKVDVINEFLPLEVRGQIFLRVVVNCAEPG